MEKFNTLILFMKRIIRNTLNSKLSVISVIVVISLVSILSCSSGNDGASGTIASNDFAIYKIDILNFAFSPQTLSVEIGDKVVWTNTANDAHRVVWDNGTFSSSDNLDIFQTYEVFMTTSGTFSYFCGIHSSMTGSITVNPAS